MAAFEALRSFDYPVLKFLNLTIASAVGDQFWLTITQLHKIWWVRFIVAPLGLAALAYQLRAQALKPLLMVGLTVGLTDVVAYRFIKAAVGRPRPYLNVEISSWVRHVGGSHGSSFPSSHAANAFAGASVLSWYFADKRRYFYLLAFLIAVSRPALGVHYPTDVIAGAWLGSIVAFFVTTMVLSRVPELRLSTAETPQSGEWRKRFERESDR